MRSIASLAVILLAGLPAGLYAQGAADEEPVVTAQRLEQLVGALSSPSWRAANTVARTWFDWTPPQVMSAVAVEVASFVAM